MMWRPYQQSRKLRVTQSSRQAMLKARQRANGRPRCVFACFLYAFVCAFACVFSCLRVYVCVCLYVIACFKAQTQEIAWMLSMP